MNNKPWIGVDLDGTLAEYYEWHNITIIGKPVAPVVERVKQALANGCDVRIMTARVADQQTREEAKTYINKWCAQHIGTVLPVTHEKDYMMVELWDDRTKQIIPNTGEFVEETCAELKKVIVQLANALECNSIVKGWVNCEPVYPKLTKQALDNPLVKQVISEFTDD